MSGSVNASSSSANLPEDDEMNPDDFQPNEQLLLRAVALLTGSVMAEPSERLPTSLPEASIGPAAARGRSDRSVVRYVRRAHGAGLHPWQPQRRPGESRCRSSPGRCAPQFVRSGMNFEHSTGVGSPTGAVQRKCARTRCPRRSGRCDGESQAISTVRHLMFSASRIAGRTPRVVSIDSSMVASSTSPAAAASRFRRLSRG